MIPSTPTEFAVALSDAFRHNDIKTLRVEGPLVGDAGSPLKRSGFKPYKKNLTMAVVGIGSSGPGHQCTASLPGPKSCNRLPKSRTIWKSVPQRRPALQRGGGFLLSVFPHCSPY